MPAANGRDDLNLFRSHRGTAIKLVITDVIMPVRGGKALAEGLKTHFADVKVLFTSGYTDDAIAHHGVLNPDVEFLPKPYTPALLADKFRQMLDQTNPTAATSNGTKPKTPTAG